MIFRSTIKSKWESIRSRSGGKSRSAGRRRKQNYVSLVLVAYNIPRELPRTLLSLSSSYQRDVAIDDYEVIVVDNGSTPPVDAAFIAGFGSNFRLIRIEDAPPSPAMAVNAGIAAAQGDIVGVMIDGARLVTPGLINFARAGVGMSQAAVVVAPGWYLGGDLQMHAGENGYTREIEDKLLESISWPEDGYRLFEIGTMDESSTDPWFIEIAEANALFLSSENWAKLGGMDEGFKFPGGGLVNLDTLERAMQLPGAKLTILLGEATFHQLHGGVSTNARVEQQPENWRIWKAERDSLRKSEFLFHKPIAFVGSIPPAMKPHLLRSAAASSARIARETEASLLLQMYPDDPPADVAASVLTQVAKDNFARGNYLAAADILRLASARAPLTLARSGLFSAVNSLARKKDTAAPDAAYFVALGDAHARLGETDVATRYYRRAVDIQPDTVEAHTGLANLRMTGPFYHDWIERLYKELEPAVVIEIGVFDGRSLSKVKTPTIAIGIDPSPRVTETLGAETHIFAETSDEFFSRAGADPFLAGRKLGVGFIDGLHTFAQVLRDFVNLEQLCGPESVLLLHDTAPLDEATQRVPPVTQFHTGDVWKIVPALKELRPDLDVFTIATPWTGLTVVGGFGDSRPDESWVDLAAQRFGEMSFGDIGNLEDAINLVPNAWEPVLARLHARRQQRRR